MVKVNLGELQERASSAIFDFLYLALPVLASCIALPPGSL